MGVIDIPEGRQLQLIHCLNSGSFRAASVACAGRLSETAAEAISSRLQSGGIVEAVLHAGELLFEERNSDTADLSGVVEISFFSAKQEETEQGKEGIETDNMVGQVDGFTHPHVMTCGSMAELQKILDRRFSGGKHPQEGSQARSSAR